MTVSKVAFVMYPVADMARAISFYRDTLGLQPDGLALDYWAEFNVGGTTFGVGNFEQVGTPGTGQSLALEVEDMEATRKELSAKGFETNEPHETPICFISGVKDPDGNSVLLHQAKS
ncbi:MAG: VOC family protein [Candidatus Eremiobacteraeota bacterium]|nr:VOC family protein [Candidatus Eremiobacteraeota bacterium]